MDRRRTLWAKAYTGLHVTPWLIERWLADIEKDPVGALEMARLFTEALEVPRLVVLGFNPQPLVAALAVNEDKLKVLTSQEVAKGSVEAAAVSHRVLEAFRGLVEVVITQLTPSPGENPLKALRSLEGVLSSIKGGVIDVTDAPPLVVVIACSQSCTLTYTYSTGESVRVVPISYGAKRTLIS
ncbi:MAG: hypothetical protein DRJ97_01150 [Thermoprotei archaeon]|nr:MAG: hypothetical protein DRJ97_01150 [Thermoprotei archaeon]